MTKKKRYIPYVVYILLWLLFACLLDLLPWRLTNVVYCVSALVYLAVTDYIYSGRTAEYLHQEYPEACNAILLEERTDGLPWAETGMENCLPLRTLLRGLRSGRFGDTDSTLRRIRRNSTLYADLFRVYMLVSAVWRLCRCLNADIA